MYAPFEKQRKRVHNKNEKRTRARSLEERRQSLAPSHLMYKVVEGLVSALPTDAFVTFSKHKRQIKQKTFGDCVTINPVEKHKTNNSKCFLRMQLCLVDGSNV
jgi:hypothetical protein